MAEKLEKVSPRDKESSSSVELKCGTMARESRSFPVGYQ
jgi:hypothetical protein